MGRQKEFRELQLKELRIEYWEKYRKLPNLSELYLDMSKTEVEI